MKKSLLNALTLLSLSATPVVSATNQSINEKNQKNDIIINDIKHYEKNHYTEKSADLVGSSRITLINWRTYANTWVDFLSKYKTFKFTNSYVTIELEAIKLNTLSNPEDYTKKIANFGDFYFSLATSYKDLYINFDLNIWHDNTNIYWSWQATINNWYSSYIEIALNQIKFN